MSYLTQSRRSSPGSMAAVAAIHAGVGVLLVTGLTVSGAIAERDILQTWDLKDPPPPPEPEVEPPQQAKPDEATLPPLNVPKPPVDLNKAEPTQKTTEEILPPLPPMPKPSATGTVQPDPLPPPPRFEPMKAKPKNNPGAWLSDADYRSSWINQQLTGTARFRLEVAANGRVTGCQITGSTGHTPLDEATCALVTKRARFEPARGRDGEAVAGSYAGSVLWRLPE